MGLDKVHGPLTWQRRKVSSMKIIAHVHVRIHAWKISLTSRMPSFVLISRTISPPLPLPIRGKEGVWWPCIQLVVRWNAIIAKTSQVTMNNAGPTVCTHTASKSLLSNKLKSRIWLANPIARSTRCMHGHQTLFLLRLKGLASKTTFCLCTHFHIHIHTDSTSN